MNVAAFIVAAVNIPQIIECSSPESATFDKFCFTPVRAHSNSRVLVSVSLRVFCNCAHSAGFTRHRRSAWRKGGGPLLPLPNFPLLRATSTHHPQHPIPTSWNTTQKRGPHAPIRRGPLCDHAQPRPVKPLANGGHLRSTTARRSSCPPWARPALHSTSVQHLHCTT